MMLPKISNPCPEKWEEMSQGEQGRFCAKCCKVVIDFTKKTTQEIIDFLNARPGEEICGKLRLNPIPVRTKPRMKVFTAALFVVFGSLLFTACGSETQEEPVGKVGIDSATQAQQQHYNDSLAHADSLKSPSLPASNESTNIDSAKMVEMMKLLDSVNASKKK